MKRIRKPRQDNPENELHLAQLNNGISDKSLAFRLIHLELYLLCLNSIFSPSVGTRLNASRFRQQDCFVLEDSDLIAVSIFFNLLCVCRFVILFIIY